MKARHGFAAALALPLAASAAEIEPVTAATFDAAKAAGTPILVDVSTPPSLSTGSGAPPAGRSTPSCRTSKPRRSSGTSSSSTSTRRSACRASSACGCRTDARFGGFSKDGLGGQFGPGLLLGAVWNPRVGPTLGAAPVDASPAGLADAATRFGGASGAARLRSAPLAALQAANFHVPRPANLTS